MILADNFLAAQDFQVHNHLVVFIGLVLWVLGHALVLHMDFHVRIGRAYNVMDTIRNERREMGFQRVTQGSVHFQNRLMLRIVLGQGILELHESIHDLILIVRDRLVVLFERT